MYRIEQDIDNATIVRIRAWRGDDVTGRIVDGATFGVAETDEYDGPRVRAEWLDSRDTDGIHELPSPIRDLLWEFDDAIREALRRL